MPSDSHRRIPERCLGVIAVLFGLYWCALALFGVYAAWPGLSQDERIFYVMAPALSLIVGLFAVIVGLRAVRPAGPLMLRSLSLIIFLCLWNLTIALSHAFLPPLPVRPMASAERPLSQAEIINAVVSLLEGITCAVAGVILYRWLRRRSVAVHPEMGGADAVPPTVSPLPPA